MVVKAETEIAEQGWTLRALSLSSYNVSIS